MKLLCISGSLRPNSSAASVIHTLASLAPRDIDFFIYNNIGDLPHFNDNHEDPGPVKNFKIKLREADAIIICTPEYAYGVPGSLKNALDWTVATGEFVDKPVAVITAALGGQHAHASLLLTLSALSAKIVDGATMVISFIRSKLDDKGNVTDAATLQLLSMVMEAVTKAQIEM